MSDDLLSKMTRALAEEHDGTTAVPGATRARVVRTLAERKPRRKKWLAVGIPAFVLFGGSTAWAAATGNLPPVMQKVVAVLIGDVAVDEPAAEAPVAQRSGKWAPPPTPIEEATALVEEEVEEEPEEETVEPQVEEAKSEPPKIASVASNPKPTTADRPTNADLPPEDHTALVTYRAAHRAHFRQGDCAGAVSGYRKYLREQPSGTFALEAKYNLGVCLIRMGQTAEAKRLLQPFADGAHGNYRKEKSQELIDALGN